MFIDNKGRLFGKINIIDMLILLIIAGAAAGAYVKFFKKDDKAVQSDRKIQYDIEIKAQTKEFADVIQTGDEIRDSIRSDYLGKVVNKQVVPTIEVNANIEEGTFVTTEVPERYDIILTLEANGSVSGTSIKAEGTEIKVGQRMYIKGKGYAGSGYILRISYE
ncbi:MAG: DUF4330 domain-containing protein [Clostridiaceae bacterium]|nr:DUF4330 domain-containing protein [Clostridiaceae bacterium]